MAAAVADSDPAAPATSICVHCQREIPSSNIDLHSVHCARNLQKCQHCGEMVPRKLIDEHYDENHAPLNCSLCKETIERESWDLHKSEKCPQRMVACEYCEFELPAVDLYEHQVAAVAVGPWVAPIVVSADWLDCCCCWASCFSTSMMSSSSSSSGVSLTRCPVLFDGTNFRDWTPHLQIHMRRLHLWGFLSGEFSCPPHPTPLAQPVLPVEPPAPSLDATATQKTKYDRLLAAHDSQVARLQTAYDGYLGIIPVHIIKAGLSSR
ncbi:hypothetical protein PR202_ga25709 [Eleusine coracana subsp. coracana]|uniref:TRAF-type domain-containing protein n=1 Tax=Eleusine coracana subsp. coracana TaxID=191504 RepID=A0AAV5DCM0_ELECO|nr:hypothetical protein PR202_ga25709 [Eleusine coracana subsp. coracana]